MKMENKRYEGSFKDDIPNMEFSNIITIVESYKQAKNFFIKAKQHLLIFIIKMEIKASGLYVNQIER